MASILSSSLFYVAVLLHLLFVPAWGICQRCQPMNIMVPAYFDPAFYPQGWTSLNAAASRLPSRVVAIANPDNGPGASVQASYTNAFSAFSSNSGRVFGYVRTNYTVRAAAAVKADIDAWFSFYPQTSGIFLDEASNTAGNEAYYQDLYNYIKSKNSTATVVNNPGSPTLESYLFFNGSRVTDVVCTFENGVGGPQATQSPWTSNYDRYNFLALFYNVTDVNVASFDYRDAIDRAYQQNFGWVYVTDDSLPNPWDTIPGYFVSGEVEYIRNNNQCR